ncbi:MAG: gamma-glutamyl-gamma-aminobutyrate hydrolase family protein [Acidimicrobiia bacterium]|nr:gamma-glutamyl-gamma-aminobutyrate hydrolase family protein [Acidimicrobiia bacterium]
MSAVSVLLHLEDTGPGHLATALDANRVDWDVIRVADGEQLPDPSRSPAVVVLGGAIGAYEIEANPFLVEEMEFLRTVIGAGIPVLGICLGAQVVAAAMGGRAFKADLPEIGLVDFTFTAVGERDPIMMALGGPMVAVHEDTFSLPDGAQLLASTSYPHAFRVGSALAVQFHPEVDSAIVATWLEHDTDDLFREAGVDPDEFLRQVQQHDVALEERALRFFNAWLADAGLI